MFNTMKEIRDIAGCMPGCTAVYKLGHTVERLYCSDDLAELMGYTVEELQEKAQSPLSFIYEEDIPDVKNKIVRAVAQHAKLEISYRFRHKSGNLKWVRLHGNYIGDLDGAAVYLTSIFDVSEEWNSRNAILDSSNRGVVVFDKNSKTVLYGNERFFNFADTSRDACIGHPCYEVVCRAGVYDKNQCICFKAIGMTEPLVTHNEVTDRTYEIAASETMWGEHSAIIFYTTDITQSTKQTREIAEKNAKLQEVQEEAIRNYKQQLELITDGSSDVLSTCRLNLTRNTCIPGTSRTKLMRKLQSDGTADGYFRLGRTSLEQESVDNLSSYPTVAGLLEAFDKGQKTISGDGYFRVEEGKTLYVRTTVQMARNPITQDVEAILYTRDLTGVKLQNDIMRCLMEKQYESISVINVKTRKVSVFSYSYDGVAGSQYDGEDFDTCRKFFTETYVAESDRERYLRCGDLAQITKMLEREGHYAFVFRFEDETGEERIKTIEYYYTDERRTTLIGATRDITEISEQQRQNLENLKAALLRADKATEAKSAFFSNVSHDMRTPLNGILGFSDLGRETQSLDEARTYFGKIQSSGKFLLKLINDTLDISKIESGQMKLTPARVNLDELLGETVNAVEETARAKSIALLVVRPKDTRTCVNTDKLRLEQLLTNLLGNAIKFTPEGGTVRFTVRELPVPEQGCNYKITVQDNGVGMNAAFIPHAFEAYTQGENATSKAAGTGLGLAIAKQIVTQMKGEISLESEEGKGTLFTILLPLEVIREEEEEEKNESCTLELTGKRILLCEDHPINRELACRLLERKGMKIDCAENGKIGVEMFEKSAPGTYDVILMDIRMPEMNGLEAAEAIRKLQRPDAAAIPIIAMTANAYESDKKAALRFGMNAHLPKPIDPKLLYRTLDEYIHAAPQAHPGDGYGWKPKVIVVDDLEVNVAVIKAAIEKCYTVFEAYGAEEALRILEREAGIAAVITDIQMPGMNGVELIEAIRADHNYDRVAILANTQHGEPNQEENLLALGADDFIYKPSVAPVVLARLNNVVHKYK